MCQSSLAASFPTGSVYGFRLHPTTGAPTPVAGSPIATPPRPSAFAASANLPPSIQVDAGDNVVASVGAYGGRPPYTWSIASGALPPGIALNATTGIVSGTASAAGTCSSVSSATDSVGATANATKSITVASGTVTTPVTVVEFYNASLDHYFITYVADEIAKLDNGTFKGWARTGLSFNAFATTQSSSSNPASRRREPPLHDVAHGTRPDGGQGMARGGRRRGHRRDVRAGLSTPRARFRADDKKGELAFAPFFLQLR